MSVGVFASLAERRMCIICVVRADVSRGRRGAAADPRTRAQIGHADPVTPWVTPVYLYNHASHTQALLLFLQDGPRLRIRKCQVVRAGEVIINQDEGSAEEAESPTAQGIRNHRRPAELLN